MLVAAVIKTSVLLHALLLCPGSISENMAKVAAQRESLQVLFSHTIDSLSAQGTVQPIIEAVLAAEQAEVHTAPAWHGGW